ncbi:hypothetical protein Leryth_007078 [Lithospermum erythrorhizon]|nr:hypothetical protein Leryth_007078 [Lithospermum erythrorhizon]
MGIVCGKPSSANKERVDGSKERELNRKTSELKAISARRGESFRTKKRYESGEIGVNLIDKKVTGRGGEKLEYYVQGKEKNSLVGFNNFSGILSVPKAVEGEQVAAGWPSWLVEYAGEAINGWVPRRADSFEKLEKIGQGTYSSVYKAKDLKQDKLVALKRVRFDNMDPESVKFMAREILILRRLDHTNVIKLEGLVTSSASSSVYLIFEYMEHDLVGVASLPGVKFSEPQIKCYMQQLLSGLQHCHNRGVLHRDIKGSNLLIDNSGVLKIADFGLASFFDRHQKIPLTSRVVTLWYRPPELLLGANHYGVAVDLWSTGCILGELYTSKPIMPGKTEVEQLHKIFKLCGSPSEDYWRTEKLPHATAFRPQQPYKRRLADTFSDLPAAALGLLETLLSMTPTDRGNTADALKSDFFTSKPYACNPSDLPKYPPSKEIDAKLREDEARRKRASGNGQTGNYETRRSRELHAVHVPELNDGSTRPTLRQVEVEHQNPKSHNDLYNSRQKETPSKYTFNPARASQNTSRKYFPEQLPRRVAHSGPLSGGVEWSTSRKKLDDNSMTSTRDHLSAIAGSIVPKALLSEDSMNKLGSLRLEESRTNLSENSANDIGPLRLIASGQEERPSASSQNSRKQEQRHRPSLEVQSGRSHSKDLSSQRAMHGGHGWKANKITFSGPLPGPLNNVDEMLKEHDRRIQEIARRTRLERARAGKEHSQSKSNLVYVSNRGGG